MSTLKERITTILAETGLNQVGLATLCDVSEAAVSGWLADVKAIRAVNNLKKLEARYGYNPAWIAHGHLPKLSKDRAGMHLHVSEPVAMYRGDWLHELHVALQNLPKHKMAEAGKLLDAWAASGGSDAYLPLVREILIANTGKPRRTIQGG